MDFTKLDVESIHGLYEIKGNDEEISRITTYLDDNPGGECCAMTTTLVSAVPKRQPWRSRLYAYVYNHIVAVTRAGWRRRPVIAETLAGIVSRDDVITFSCALFSVAGPAGAVPTGALQDAAVLGAHRVPRLQEELQRDALQHRPAA